ncbi:MAG: DEAD/DEAH box helicase [Akkermansia sp.]
MVSQADVAHIKKSFMVPTTFQELGLTAPLLHQLEKLDYKSPTPIQAACIPLLLQQRDLMGLAQTGTGKTAAFALPLMQLIAKDKSRVRPNHVRALILSPTRELASQIHDNIIAYGRGLDLSTAVMYGGVGYGGQMKALARGLDILVATPGRLLDHMAQKNVSLRHVETLILDEADHMLDMGFAPAIKKIVAETPPQRHTQLFSATMPDNILRLAQAMLRNPETIMVASPDQTADNVEQFLFHVSSQANKKDDLLRLFSSKGAIGRTLIFTRTKHGANRLATFLNKSGYPSAAIHGDKSQGTRERMLKQFRTGETPILVATDIAARGIDVKDINLVVNFDLPAEPEVYVHRIGRTARAGADGEAISFCSPDEFKQIRGIQRLLGNPIPLHPDGGATPVELKSQSNARSMSTGKKSPQRPRPARRNNSDYSSRRR